MKKVFLIIICCSLIFLITACDSDEDNSRYKVSDKTVNICNNTIEPSDFYDGDEFDIEGYTESIEEICNDDYNDTLDQLSEVINQCDNYKEEGYESIQECIAEKS